MRRALVLLVWLLAPRVLAQPAPESGDALDAPSSGQRVYVATPGPVSFASEAGPTFACVAPCLLHVAQGRYHVEHASLSISGDLTIDDRPMIVAAHPRSDVELAFGVAGVVLGLAGAGLGLGLDASVEGGGCLAGGRCASWFPALMVPAGVVLLIGIFLIFDAGGEISAQEVFRLPSPRPASFD